MENFKALVIAIIAVLVLVGSFLITVEVAGVAAFVIFPAALIIGGGVWMIVEEVKDHFFTDYSRPSYTKQFR